MKKRCIIAGAVIFIAASFLFAQETAETPVKQDVFVILDVSGSMNGQGIFANVRDYLDAEVLGSLIKNGDNFTMVTFGERVTERFSRTINSNSDRESIKEELRTMRPNENYTDIGLAIEKLAEILGRQETAGTRRIVLFITDGVNIPSPGSRYRGVDLSVDEHFKTLGEKISRESWFLYVIGIGSETAAEDVAALIPGAELQTTGSDLSEVDIVSRVGELEEEERLRQEEEELARREAERLASMNIFQRLKNSLGLSVFATGLILVLICTLIPLILLIVILFRIYRARELVISDEKETVIKRVPVLGGVLLNSPAAVLSGIGGEHDRAFRIERGLFGLKVQTMNSQIMANNSPYKKNGTHPLKGVIVLANGSRVRVTVR